MNVKLAREIYNDCACDPSMAAAIRREKAELGLKIAQGLGAQIQSATVNGQTMSARNGMTNEERHIMLGWVVKQLNHGGHISSTQLTTF